MKSVTLHETGVDVDHFPKDKLAYLDIEGLKRQHLTIYWKCSEEELCSLIRDMLKCQYMLDYKYLQPISFKYIAQKTHTNSNTNLIDSAMVTIEPLHNDFETLISRTPINQKLDIGTNVLLEKSIGYEKNEEGKIEERKYLHSGNLVFETKLPNPCMKFVHYGAQEVGSVIRAKYLVQYANKQIGKFRLFNFRRSPTDKLFVLQLWNFYGLSMVELLELMLNYVKNQYVEPQVYTLNHNDKGTNLIEPDKLAKFLETLIQEVKKVKVEKIKMQDLLKIWNDAEK